MIVVTVNGLSMNSNTPDSNGSLWYVTGMDGWESPQLRQQTMDPDLLPGTIVTHSRWGGRIVMLQGICKASSAAGFWASYNRIQTLVTPEGNVMMSVMENTLKRLDVRLQTPAKIKILGGSAFEWSLTLLAENPDKY